MTERDTDQETRSLLQPNRSVDPAAAERDATLPTPHTGPQGLDSADPHPAEEGDPYHSRAEPSGSEQALREKAYALWEEDGRPEGRDQEYWYRAVGLENSRGKI